MNGFYFILFYFILRAVMGRCAAARANGRASLRQGQALETGSYGGAETGTTDACLSKWLSSLLWPLQTFPGWLAGRPVLEQWRVSSTSKAATQRPSSSSSRWSSKATNKQSSILLAVQRGNALSSMELGPSPRVANSDALASRHGHDTTRGPPPSVLQSSSSVSTSHHGNST